MKYFSLILLQPANPCNSIITTVTHRATQYRRKKMEKTNAWVYMEDGKFGITVSNEDGSNESLLFDSKDERKSFASEKSLVVFDLFGEL